MHLPEKVVAGTHNTELEFKRRLKAYNDLGDDSHPGKFFEDVDRPGETISKNSHQTSMIKFRDLLNRN
jgi:hypothetical protein